MKIKRKKMHAESGVSSELGMDEHGLEFEDHVKDILSCFGYPSSASHIMSGSEQGYASGTDRNATSYLRLEGYTYEEIAEIFKEHRQTIARDEKADGKMPDKLASEIDVQPIGGGAVASGKHPSAKAMKEKDYALVWTIRRKLMADSAVDEHQSTAENETARSRSVWDQAEP